MQVLQLDRNGYPTNWLSPREAAMYYATDAICWTLGDVCSTLRGGMNSVTGCQSKIDVHPIIAVTGASTINLFDVVPSLTNQKLFARDLWTCTYCGTVHPGGAGLTCDHIIPASRGGLRSWANAASSCAGCNHFKRDRTPEEAKMPLRFLPYVPSVFEDFLLKGRNIQGEAYNFLVSRVSKNSRWATAH